MEHPQDNIPNSASFEKNINKTDINSENQIDHDTEKLAEKIESRAQIDLENFERSNDDFINAQWSTIVTEEKPLELQVGVREVQEKYKKEKRKLKSTFLSVLNKVGKVIIDGTMMVILLGHINQKEYPEYLDKNNEKTPNKIEWNQATTKEIKKLAHEYALIIKTDTAGYGKIPIEFFEARFENFVANYGPDIQIVHPGDNMDIKDQVYDFLFEKILRQSKGRAHDGFGGTIFYENKTLSKKHGADEDPDRYDLETSSLRDFAAEFSHHINNDWSLQRSSVYVDGLLRSGFQQGDMYEDPFSPEYQAHTITQSAISEYLFPDSNDLSVNFVDVYNTKQEYYRELIKMKKYTNNEELQFLTWNLFYNKFSKQVSDKEAIFKNLAGIRHAIDNANIPNDKQNIFFSIMVKQFKLNVPNNNYEKITEEAEGVIEIFEDKNNALNDSTQFGKLATDLENRFRSDFDYVYVTIAPEIFDKDYDDEMKQKISKTFSNAYLYQDSKQIESMEKLNRMNIYATLKSIEGQSLGYGSNSEYDLNRSFYNYKSDLSDVEIFLEKRDSGSDSRNVIHLKHEQFEIRKYEQLARILVLYCKNDTSGLISFIKNASDITDNPDESINTMFIKLLKGLETYGSPDLKRDFFVNGKSPLPDLLGLK